MKKIQLTEAEFQIMQQLWESAPQTLMQLTRALQEATSWTKHTVLTLLKRMEEKGTVLSQQQGRTQQFAPAVTRQAVARQRTRSLLDQLFGGKLSLLVSEMTRQEDIPQAELDAILEAIRSARKPGEQQ